MLPLWIVGPVRCCNVIDSLLLLPLVLLLVTGLKLGQVYMRRGSCTQSRKKFLGDLWKIDINFNFWISQFLSHLLGEYEKIFSTKVTWLRNCLQLFCETWIWNIPFAFFFYTKIINTFLLLNKNSKYFPHT